MQLLREFVAFDLETTGLSPEADSLLEIGAVRVKDGVLGERFSQVVKPRTAVSALARHMTGLTEAELSQGGEAAEVLKAFLDFAGQAPLVAHNSDFDLTFLRAELTRAGMEVPAFVGFDSLLISRMAWPLWPNHKLEAIAQRLDLPQGRGHRALPDAEWAALTWIQAEKVLQGNSAVTQALDVLLAKAPAPWPLLADAATASGALPWKSPAAAAGISGKPSLPEGWWKAGGVLAQAMGDSGKLEWPEKLLSELHRTLHDGRWSSLESADSRLPTLALASALAHAAASGKSVLVVVPDLRVEDALLTVAQAQVAQAFGFTPRLQVLREPDGYFSPSRCGDFLRRAETCFSAEERLHLLPLLAWGLATETGDMAVFPGIAGERFRPLGLKVTASGYGSDEVFAQAARRAAERAQVIVVRHDTFLRDLELEGALIPAVDGVLILDAHRLTETMESISGREISFFRVRHALQLIAASAEEPSGLAAWLQALAAERAWPAEAAPLIAAMPEKSVLAEKSVQRWLAKIGRQVEKRAKAGESRVRYRERLAIELSAPEAPVLESLQALLDDAQSISGILSQILPLPESAPELKTERERAVKELGRLAARLGEIKTLVSRISDPGETEVAWVEEYQNPHKIRLRLRSLLASTHFVEKLANLHRGGAALGSVLSLGDGTQKLFAKRFGFAFMGKPVRYVVETPAVGERLALLTPFAPSPQGADSAKPLGELLAQALSGFEVPTVLFAPSHTLIKSLRESLTRLLPSRTVIGQGIDGQRDALTYLFKQTKAPILLAQEWSADWMDAEGQRPRLLIVARIPFAPPSDPMIAARSERMQQDGVHPLFELLVPEAGARLKEAVQRVRQPGLRQVIWVLDPRVARERYGSFLVRGMAAESRSCPDVDGLLNESRQWLAS